MIRDLAHVYSQVFAPELFLLVCVVGLVIYERNQTSQAPRAALLPQIATIGLAWGIAFLLMQLSNVLFTNPPYWIADLFAGLGITVGFSVITVIWIRNGWGHLLPELAVVLIALTIIHSVLVPVWNISSHVAYTAASVGYLLTLSRRFLPTVLIPSGMILSRPLIGAHTWGEAIGGGIVAILVLGSFVVIIKPKFLSYVLGRAPTTRSANQ